MTKILLFDVETAPKRGYIWRLYDENISLDQLISCSYVLSWSAKWLDDEEHYYCDSLHYHDLWKTEPDNDSLVVQSLWELMDEADILIAHNGDRFDIPVMNARFVYHNMQPPSSYRTIDTCKIAKSKFRFDSNKLQFLAQFLFDDSKVDTGGFSLWRDCLEGSKKSFDLMMEYCIHDTYLLERVYKRLAPFYDRHPNVFLDESLDKPACPVCGSTKIKKNGYYTTNTQRYRKLKCTACGHNLRHRKGEDSTRGNYNILKSI